MNKVYRKERKDNDEQKPELEMGRGDEVRSSIQVRVCVY